MNWLPKREKLDPKQASEYPPAVRPLAKPVAREVMTSSLRRTGTSMCRARSGRGGLSCWPVRMMV